MTDVLDLPTRRHEEWRWSRLDALPALAATPRGSAQDAAQHFIGLGGPQLVFVDGVLDEGASVPGRVSVEALDLVTDHPLGRHATGAGWSLTLDAEQAAEPIEIVHVASGGANHLPARIMLAEGAVASIVETYVGAGWSNRLTQIELARSARLMRSVRLLQASGFVSVRDEALVGKHANLVSIFLGAGGMDCRIDGAINVHGDTAFAEMGGALLTEREQHQECAVAVRHDAVGGKSRQVWRAVAKDKSAVSLAARVEVARAAQKTDGEQSLRGLLLDRTATVNLKPELEIFADDVKCAHGATVGELDARALFYLESRGIAPARARGLLTRAFVADALDWIDNETVRDAFAADAERWLEKAL
ncbi:SufD family Fe-S cluster assembly protein [Hephaestia sp. GCM10023244]|uniref:SufD family Fe-S cluster assembly protein n=1 Tax=unclassified Hephaestia TaxID=2631281 RepID=UPI002076DB25|nr:SufD family Fe-S cluster assembly protein [Hephaestia sp. MAHUQ-44]MCM8732114.1 SufD family Fe-S cluster assembly protein [Hephaestia sp. MAHUQ-44]